MKNFPHITNSEYPLTVEKANTFHFDQSGEGTNIGVAENVNTTNVNVIIIPKNNATDVPLNIPKTINMEYFNLFVISGEQYDKPYFIVDVKRALTIDEGTEKSIHNRLSSFSEEAKAEIMSYPCIFASENYRYSPPVIPPIGPQNAQYGYITQIQQIQNGNLKIYFHLIPICPIPQELLNTMITELDLQGHKKFNEFDRTHWSIKNVNVIEELRLKGVNLLLPSIL